MDSLETAYKYYDYDNYTYEYDNSTPSEEGEVFKNNDSPCHKEVSCVALLAVNVAVFLLGLCGNGAVIWTAGFKMKRTVNTTWYLSLAVSDFIFCACLPFGIAYLALGEWVFGRFMCKLTSFVMFLNMFSSIFLMVVISADRCVSVAFPVWAQNRRTLRKSSAVVLSAWAAAVALSVPSVIFRDVRRQGTTVVCFNDYADQRGHTVVAVSRFVGGFVVPFFVIIVCYSVIILKLRTNRMTKSSKPFKVMTALIATFFVCWLPYHVFILLELTHLKHRAVVGVGLKVGVCVAAANSSLNPMLYVFMGNDFKRRLKRSVLSKMENALGEEGRTSSRYMSRFSSVDGPASTHI